MTNCSTNVCGTGSWSGPKPGDPDNSSVLTAVSEFGGIRLKWTMPNLNPFAVAHTRILRNTTANLSSATELAVYSGNVYFDATAAVDPIVTYYYWIQHVSINGTDLETLGPASGTAKPGIDEVIAKLANKIEFSSLASSLRSRIERITDLENGITQINQSIANDNQILSWELQAIKNDLTQAVAYVNNQLNIAADERVALVESINTLLAGFGDANTVALREESRVRAEETGALFAEKIVKADLAGNVVGYGLSAYKDPSGNFSSDFRVAADTFSVAPPAIVQATAPSSDNYNGKVWVDNSNALKPVPKWYNISTKAWQTTPVKASTPFYIQTTSSTVNGEVIPAGVYIDSAYISQLKANQIDTRGLTIRDNEGKIILSAGDALDWNRVGGTGKPESGATRNVYIGDWSSTSISYLVGDIVIESGYGSICRKKHDPSTTVKPPVYPNTNEYWKVHTIKGADGVSGNYTDYVFTRSDSTPGTPTATSGIPVGWSDTPPTTGTGLLYMSKATKKADGTVVGSWSVPARLDGKIGADGKYTEYQYAVGATAPAADATTWGASPTTPGAGQFLWMRSRVVDPAATVPAWGSAVRISGEKGDQGASAKGLYLSATSQVFQISKAGTASPASITFTATGQNLAGSPTFTPPSGVTLTGTGTTRTLAYTGLTTDTATVKVTWDGLEDTITVAKVREGADGSAGANAITVILSNEAHTLPASSAGAVSSYTGSGTTVTVYEGSTALSASATATTSAFRVGTITQSPASTITLGAVTYSGTTATVADHSGMVNSTDSVVLTIPITVYRASGATVSFSKLQTITKAKAGLKGDTSTTPGPRGPAFATIAADTTISTAAFDSAFTTKTGLSPANGDQVMRAATIYTRTSTGWDNTTLLQVHGDAVIKGTLAADRLAAGIVQASLSFESAGYFYGSGAGKAGTAKINNTSTSDTSVSYIGKFAAPASSATVGVIGTTASTTSGAGVYGESPAGTTEAAGVVGCGSYGVVGKSLSSGAFSVGVVGRALGGSGTGVYGEGPTIGVHAVGSGGLAFKATGNAEFTGNISAVGNVTAYSSSDRRLKTRIRPISGALEKVAALRGVYYDWTDEYLASQGGEDGYFVRREDVGVIAQEVQAVLPEIVAERADGMLAVKYERLVSVLIEAVKELQARVEVLEAK